MTAAAESGGGLVTSLLLVAAGGVGTYLWLRHDRQRQDTPAGAAPTPPGAPTPPTPPRPLPPLTGKWVWPVPKWQGRAPVISSGFGTPRIGAPNNSHAGVDIMFARIASDSFKPGTPNADVSGHFVMPDGWTVIAASDGVLWSVGKQPRGYAVVIDHGPVATFYTHMESLLVPEFAALDPKYPIPPSRKVQAGQPLGILGYDPLDPAKLKHLHFELWNGGPKDAVDPDPIMKGWQVLSSDDIKPFLEHRNARRKRDPDFVQVRGYERRFPGSSLNKPG